MPHEGHFPGSPAEWLRYARSDLELARVKRPPKVLLSCSTGDGKNAEGGNDC